jgi:serine/threonine protein kinase
MSAESDTSTDLGPAVRALAAGQVVFGRYELRRKLGEGGFGAVWLVHDRRLREEVALKFVLQAVAASPEAIDALMAEAARSRKLTHPNIVRIHDFISDAVGDAQPDLAGISMEYVDGESLAYWRLRQPGKCFDVEQIAPWIDQLCQALTYAHAPKRRVIHRDLKPANLLLSSDGELKVADFGIACSLLNSVTHIGSRLSSGTPPFMSPQQLGGDWPSESDDIYSLGATIYSLLTGTPPFHQGDIRSQVIGKLAEPMPERRERLGAASRSPIPADWAETVGACLAKETADRPASVEEVAQRLGLRPYFSAPASLIPSVPEPSNWEVMSPTGTPEEVGTDPPAAAAVPFAPRTPMRRKWLLVPLLLLVLFGSYVFSLKKPAALPFPTNPMLKGNVLFGDHWGYVDGFGHEVIPSHWDRAASFSEGLARVESDGKYGYIDPKGVLVIPAQWETADSFSEGLAVVMSESKYGYIEPKGRLVIPAQWHLAWAFSEGLARIASNSRHGFIDPKGVLVIPAQWEDGDSFSEGRARVTINGKYGYIDSKGVLVVPAQWEDAGRFAGHFAAVKSEGKYGYIDAKGKIVIPAQWMFAESFSEGLAAVQSGSDHKKGYIDPNGKLVIPLQWTDAGKFFGGLAVVRINAKCGCIDRNGARVIPLEWDDAEVVNAADGKAYVRLARVKQGSLPSSKDGAAPAEVRWVDATGRTLWQSP